MKFTKIASFLTGVAALVGVSFAPNPAVAMIPTYELQIQNVTEQTPVFLERSVSGEQEFVAQHYSHRSHSSHSSHRSHYSHYSSRY